MIDEQQLTRRKDDNEQGEIWPDKCRKCGIEHESKEDIKNYSKWLGYDFKIQKNKNEWEENYNYWVHEKCVGIYILR